MDPEHTLHPDFFLHDLRTSETRRLTDDIPSIPDSHPVHPVWLDDRHVLANMVRHGASGLELIDTETGAVEIVDRWPARRSGFSVDRGRRYVVQSQSAFDSVGEIVVYDRETGTATAVTAHNLEVLRERPPASWERIGVRRGSLEIDTWLLLPPDLDPQKRYPVVLDVHGGPTANYGYGFMAHQQCLASHGLLVVYANPRGSSSYGRDFACQIVGDWGGEDYQDVLAALDAVLERPYADADRTGIFGISYGGYLTAWAIGHTHRFKAAVCGSPIFDLASDYGTSDVAHNGLERFAGGPPHRERDWYLAHSPSTFAHLTRTPTLIFHGEADERCPIGQSEQMFVALKKAGCEVEFLRYPGASHMFFATGHPEHRADWLARILAWFQQHLGGPV